VQKHAQELASIHAPAQSELEGAHLGDLFVGAFGERRGQSFHQVGCEPFTLQANGAVLQLGLGRGGARPLGERVIGAGSDEIARHDRGRPGVLRRARRSRGNGRHDLGETVEVPPQRAAKFHPHERTQERHQGAVPRDVRYRRHRCSAALRIAQTRVKTAPRHGSFEKPPLAMNEPPLYPFVRGFDPFDGKPELLRIANPYALALVLAPAVASGCQAARAIPPVRIRDETPHDRARGAVAPLEARFIDATGHSTTMLSAPERRRPKDPRWIYLAILWMALVLSGRPSRPSARG
jgi:hypothetical protein